ncbi:MAG: hypothetical protein ACFFDR_14415 [Candidatus Thorarchaeota archaeon]
MMNRLEILLVILVPLMCLLTAIVLPLFGLVPHGIHIFVSIIVVGASLFVTLILIARQKYSSSEAFTILLASILSLVGYFYTIVILGGSVSLIPLIIDVTLTGVGIILSLLLLRRRPIERIQVEDSSKESAGESKPESSLRRTLRIWREPILYVVGFMIVGIIGMLIIRPPSTIMDIPITIGVGILFGLLGVCYFVGTGRTKIK